MPHNHMPREITCFNHLSFLTYDQFQCANKSTIKAICRKMTKRFDYENDFENDFNIFELSVQSVRKRKVSTNSRQI